MQGTVECEFKPEDISFKKNLSYVVLGEAPIPRHSAGFRYVGTQSVLSGPLYEFCRWSSEASFGLPLANRTFSPWVREFQSQRLAEIGADGVEIGVSSPTLQKITLKFFAVWV